MLRLSHFQSSLFLVLYAIASIAYADKPIPSPFPALRTYTIYPSPLESYQPPTQISYDPSLAKLIRKPVDVEFNRQGIGEIEVTRVLSTKIDRNKSENFLIDFDPGASGDPAFVVLPENAKSAIGVIEADHLVLPGNGSIYALARSNKNFIERRKYAIRDNKVVEVKQPYLYVGLDTQSNKNFGIYSSKTEGELVASVRAGDKLSVLINEGEYYLVKTTFGLTGWVKINDGSLTDDTIKGIYFAGD